MRLLVLSDTHGDLSRMFASFEYLKALDADLLVHLGDLTSDAVLLSRELRLPLRAVAGNCDGGYSPYPPTDVLNVEGVRILLCHGHQYGVNEGLERLLYAAEEKECRAVLFGHTHRPHLSREEGIMLMNPGSLCRPRVSEAGLGLVTVENGTIKGLLLPFHAENMKKLT